eukprot:2997174-Amphidinium_carterae.1
MVSTVQKTVEIPQVQILEVIQDMPIIKDRCHIMLRERKVPMVSTVQKVVEIPQVLNVGCWAHVVWAGAVLRECPFKKYSARCSTLTRFWTCP